MIFQDAREIQIRPPKTVVHRRPIGPLHKFCQIITGAQPRQDAIAFPTPGNHFLARQIRREIPFVFQRVSLMPR